MPQTRTYETLVGLHVTDDAQYARYRAQMMPILRRYGGRFRYDFEVSRVLTGPDATPPINRVFVIVFPDEQTKKAFFADPAYRVVREAHFRPSVAATTILAEYTRTENAGDQP